MKEPDIKCKLCQDLGVILYSGDDGLSGCYECALGKTLLCENCKTTLRNEGGMGYCCVCQELYAVSDEIAVVLMCIDESWSAQ